MHDDTIYRGRKKNTVPFLFFFAGLVVAVQVSCCFDTQSRYAPSLERKRQKQEKNERFLRRRNSFL